MNDVASIRAEIKNWERTFRANEGRDPSVDDIKKLPQIAQKYKLYKKLSKAATSLPTPKQFNTSQATSQSPSTPTRSARTRIDHAPLAALNSRVVTSTAPLSSFNPFSPQKAKGKERERPTAHISQPLFNPFASPSKPRPQAQSSKAQGLFPLLQSPSKPPSPPPPPSAVVRARKRLRGEPVSPSPSKEKRRKTVSQTTLNFPRLNFASRKGTLFNDAVQQEEDNEDAFIDDSPVKASTRKFSHLFDEAQPGTTSDIFSLKNGTSSKLSKDLFGATDIPMKSSKSSASSTSSQDDDDDDELTSSRRPTFHTRLTSPLEELELSGNRDLPDDDLEEESSNTRSKSPLIPPSPPPASSTTSRAAAKGKRKASSKTMSQRKKMKVAAVGAGSDDEGSTSDSSDLKAKVKIVSRPQAKKANIDDDDLGPDFDPVLDLPRAPRPEADPINFHPEETETVEINLPDKFKEVLDLDPSHWEDHYVEEDKLVKGLIYGRRVASYDPKKGEIWDVGEDEVEDDEEKRRLIDDDWEGEPVPWEAAEL